MKSLKIILLTAALSLLGVVQVEASLLSSVIGLMAAHTAPTYPYSNTTYSTPGTYTFTVPANCTSLTAHVVGAGGGGAGAGSDYDACNGDDGGPGTVSLIRHVFTGSSTIMAKAAAGAGGSGGGSNGTDGGVGTDVYTGLTRQVGGTNSARGGFGTDGINGGWGGRGNVVYGSISVTPGDTLRVVVGTGGYYGTGCASQQNGATGVNGFVTLTWGTSTGSSWTEDWSAGNMDNWTVFAGNKWEYHSDDGLMGSNFVRFDNSTGISTPAWLKGTAMQSHAYFKPSTPASISFKVRAHITGTPSSSNRMWFGGNLYTGEGQYVGAEMGQYTNPAQQAAYGYNLEVLPTWAPNFAYDTVYPVTVSYDGTGLITVNWGANAPIFIGSANVFSTPFCAWIAGFVFAGSNAGYTDIGAVTFIGNMDCWAVMDANNFISWSGSFSAEEGQEQQPWSTYTGGLTAQSNHVKLTPSIYDTATKYGTRWDFGNYKTTTFNATGPAIVAPTGEKYKNLYVWGKARSGGTCKIYVRKTSDNSLVPDSEIAGNSSGLSIIGFPLTYSLSSVTATSIYLDVEGDNTGGSTSAPVILNGVEVDFQPQ